MKNWKWDYQHVVLILSALFGFYESAEPMVASLVNHTAVNPTQVLFGIVTLAITTVGTFFKASPNSLEAAVKSGEAIVSIAPGVTMPDLPKRAARLIQMPTKASTDDTPIDPPIRHKDELK